MEGIDPTFRYVAEITGKRDDGGETFSEPPQLMGAVAASEPDLDVLPPGARQISGQPQVDAILDHQAVERLVRAGFTVTLTGYNEGPVDPALVMDDDQDRADMAARMGEDRMRQAGGR